MVFITTGIDDSFIASLYKEDSHRLARFAAKVWGVDGAFYDYEQAALEGAFRMENFFRSIGLIEAIYRIAVESNASP
jgi:alcohol dehydrogenase YqhD (iron-dependent ADH family)